MSYSFPKTLRLRKRYEYKLVREKGICHFSSNLIIEVKHTNTLSKPRLGITASKRYGKAHERNRFKRIAREAFRLCHNDMPHGLEIVLKPREKAKFASTEQIIQDLKTFIKPLECPNAKEDSI